MVAHRSLRRSLGFWALVIYGVGDVLGAGIYALVGKIAGIAGPASWFAFCIALVVAALTALSYAELGGRFPRSGGEAYFCQEAFGLPRLALLIGWLVLCSGVVSLAAVTRAMAGYFVVLWPDSTALTEAMLVLGFLLLLTAINFWGIRLSSLANIVCTAVEVAGLVLVIVVASWFLAGSAGAASPPAHATAAWPPWFAIVQAAGLAFFAFIGFEDMVNVAEEVRSPERNLPLAIITSLMIAGAIYVVVVVLATAVVPGAQLASSKAPLLEVVSRAAPRIPAWLFSLIALFAVANTGLLNYIMGSRLIYGMSCQGLLPAWLGRVHPRTQTPHWAILTILVAASALALSGTLTYLAGTTSVLLLLVFFTVNLSLVRIKLGPAAAPSGFRAPLLIALCGALTTFSLVWFLPATSLLSADVVLALGLILVFFRKD